MAVVQLHRARVARRPTREALKDGSRLSKVQKSRFSAEHGQDEGLLGLGLSWQIVEFHRELPVVSISTTLLFPCKHRRGDFIQ
jgi:hypothetical protein